MAVVVLFWRAIARYRRSRRERRTPGGPDPKALEEP
jgi:hypothetical protein